MKNFEFNFCSVYYIEKRTFVSFHLLFSSAQSKFDFKSVIYLDLARNAECVEDLFCCMFSCLLFVNPEDGKCSDRTSWKTTDSDDGKKTNQSVTENVL